MKGQSRCPYAYSWLSPTHNGVQDGPHFLLLFLRLGQQVVSHGVCKDVTNDLKTGKKSQIFRVEITTYQRPKYIIIVHEHVHVVLETYM